MRRNRLNWHDFMLRSNAPEPQWQSVKKEGNIEVRDYAPMTVAETVITGKRAAAVNAGFQILSKYIAGDNKTQTKIAMSVPVTQETQSHQHEWKVRFIMPTNYTTHTLPAPNHEHIKLVALPAFRATVIRFSGRSTDDNLSGQLSKLMQWLKKQNVNASGLPTYAFYNSPWSLPFFRRNEVMLKTSM